MAQEYKTVKLRLDGQQSLSVPVDIKKNGRYITEDVDIIVRGVLKFEDEATTDTDLYESEEYQRQSANTLDDKIIVHPVLFTSERIRVTDGRGVFTLLPRSEDVLEDTETVQSRAGSDITNEQIIDSGGISSDEQITEPGKDPAIIIIETGKIRTPYKISIQITVIPLVEGGLYAQTIDRGTNPTTNENEDSSLFSKQKLRVGSNLIIECFGEDDWVPSVDHILTTNDSNYETFTDELSDLSGATPMGTSTLYSSIVSGADIMLNNDIDGQKKTIYVFTDNEASNSTASVDDAINEVNNIDGLKKTPLMISNMAISESSALSIKANKSDTRDINKMAFETGGQALTITTEDFLDDVVGIFYSEAVGAVAYGTYQFIADLGEESTINNITAYFDTAVENSNASWEIETSIDGYNYTALNKNYNADETVSFTDLLARYIKFKIVLISGFNSETDEYQSVPDSPALTNISIVYNQANIKYLYLNKETEDVIPYHTTLAVDVNEVANNEIETGVAKSDSGTWADYSTPSQPTVNQNGKVVIPIRFSTDTEEFQQEPLNKIDSFSLRTEHGSFDPFSIILLYDKDDEIIPSNLYKLYSRDGVVILAQALDTDYVDGDYKIGLLNGTDYKIGLKLTNKSESEQLLLYGVGYLYTTGKDLLPPVSKAAPEVSNVIITNGTPNRYSAIEASYTYFDSNFDEEDENLTKITWYINGSKIDYLNNLRKWNDITDPLDAFYSNTSIEFPDSDDLGNDTLEAWVKKQDDSILLANDNIYYEIQVSDGDLLSAKEKSDTVQVIESTPVMSQIFVKARDDDGNIIDRLASDTDAVIYPPLDDVFFADVDVNQSQIIWYVNDLIFKQGTFGEPFADGAVMDEIRINEIGRGEYIDYGLRINNSIVVQVIPKTDTSTGDVITSEPVIVDNSLPRVYNVAFSGNSHPSHLPLTLNWDFYDFEIIALTDSDTTLQSDKTSVSWFRKNGPGEDFEEVYIYNNQAANLEETFIDPNVTIITDLVSHNSTVVASSLGLNQTWKVRLTPNDTIDNGIVVETEEVTITPSS